MIWAILLSIWTRSDTLLKRTYASYIIAARIEQKVPEGILYYGPATDTELEVANHVIRARKQRDMEEGIPIAFELITVDLGENKYHKIITTCVMQEIELPAESDFDDLDALSKREQIALEVFMKNENENKELTLDDFRTQFGYCFVLWDTKTLSNDSKQLLNR